METITLTMPQLTHLLQLAARIGAQQAQVNPRPPSSDGKFEAILAALGGELPTVESPPVQNNTQMRGILEKLTQAFSMLQHEATPDSVHNSPHRSTDRQPTTDHNKGRHPQSQPFHHSPSHRQPPSSPFGAQFHQPAAIPQAPLPNLQHNAFPFLPDFALPVAPNPPSTPPPRQRFDFNSPSGNANPAFSNPAGHCMYEGVPNVDPLSWNGFMAHPGTQS